MIAKRIEELGFELPAAAVPVFEYVPVICHGGVAYVSGQLPKVNGEVLVRGKVGAEVSLEEAQKAARLCVLQGLACLRDALGELERVTRILKVTGFVASGPAFTDQPKVLDAASKLLVEIFGERGRHTRSAIGVAVLPRNSPVEIELLVAVSD